MLQNLLQMTFVFFVVLFLWSRPSNGAEVPSPTAEIKETIQNLKNVVGDPALKAEARKQERRAKLKELIVERMDFPEMAKRSLGRYWRNITESQRRNYVDTFSTFLETFYRKSVFESVEFINSLDIKYLKERLDEDFAEVDVQIVLPDNTVRELTFRLHLINGHWKAYDIVIEHISTIGNWRAQFDTVINKHSFEELMRILKERIEKEKIEVLNK
ncbi:MAG: ABC transporter substrate-binding protein [bacterium]|nr:ABC transporter substrate-binding protein [bacterium]